ncbi:MAG: ATP-binding cassette domain-containing protein [Lachnospiraceae bacterium]|nr:ATP-binding cassette domain-containing protein [Lachnospiraceae bacterium]
MIEFKNLNKTFRTKSHIAEAVKNVSLRIRKGEIYGIIGFSGAGKSTLVRCINMLEKPTSGSVIVDGVEVTALSEKELRKERKKIGMIFQQFHLMPSRTAFDNVALALHGLGLSGQQIREKVEKLLTYVGLEERMHAYPSQLSGGQKQRVAIARALAADPKVLLCDEATSALDPQTTRSILELLQRLNRELGITVVVITHEMQVIKRICDHVAVMENGEVVEEGEVFSIFADPKQKITRDFINTTSNLSEVYGLVEREDPLVSLSPGEVLAMLRFQKASVSEPLISSVSKQFDVVCNILYGDLDLIQGAPLGGTVVIISGKQNKVTESLRYLEEKGILVEVIKDARVSDQSIA